MSPTPWATGSTNCSGPIDARENSVGGAGIGDGGVCGAGRRHRRRKNHFAAKERSVQVTLFRAPGAAPRGSVMMLHGAAGWERQARGLHLYAPAVADSGFDAYLVYYRSDDDMQRLATAAKMSLRPASANWAKLVDDLADNLKTAEEFQWQGGADRLFRRRHPRHRRRRTRPNITAAVIYYGMDAANVGIEEKRFPPMLLLHGDADTTITWMNGECSANSKSAERPGRVRALPGEKHGFGADTATQHGGDALKRSSTSCIRNGRKVVARASFY